MATNNTKHLILMTAVTALWSLSSASYAISKCQDENGKWHYGTSVSSLCKTSEITKLDERGVVKERVAAPKTKDELAAEKNAAEKAEKIRQVEQAKAEQKNRILGVYETEADIERARQNNLRSINQQVVLSDAYTQSLKDKRDSTQKKMGSIKSKALKERLQQQINDIDVELKQSDQSLFELQEKIKEVNKRYDGELEMFRKYQSAAN